VTVLILGCGFTGRRVAARLLARGFTVLATSRAPGDIALDVLDPTSLAALRPLVPPGALVLHSIPAVAEPEPLLEVLGDRPKRVVYLSTTGVYGDAREVDETTLVAPRSPRERLRVRTEQAVQAGPWLSLVLRAAAIYGPGRGVHAAMRAGTFRLVEGGQNYVSRIHVDDLAALAEAALLGDLTGAWPVADDEPCSSLEVARFCADLMSLPLPPSIPREQATETRRADRRVDGRAIRRLLGVSLRYPSYRVGIPASLT